MVTILNITKVNNMVLPWTNQITLFCRETWRGTWKTCFRSVIYESWTMLDFGQSRYIGGIVNIFKFPKVKKILT